MSAEETKSQLALAAAESVICVLDLRNPFSYLALGPAQELRDQNGHPAVTDWLPVRHSSLKAPSKPSPEDDRGVRHRRARAEMIAREISIYADLQNLRISSPYREGEARAAYAAWLWVREHEQNRLLDFLHALFEAYWSETLDPENESDTESLLSRLGMDVAQFALWREAESTTALDEASGLLRDAGISNSPAYLIEDEVFYGRQHLPMIRWILGGRGGPPPI